MRIKHCCFLSIQHKWKSGDDSKEIEIDLAEAKEGVSESELQLLSKNLTKTVVKTKAAPMDYKIIEL